MRKREGKGNRDGERLGERKRGRTREREKERGKGTEMGKEIVNSSEREACSSCEGLSKRKKRKER